jgi:hypothetical protein
MAGDGLRGIRTGTPVPSTERESVPSRNDVHTDNWGPDGVAKYIEERFGKKLRHSHSGRRPLNLNLKREDEGEMALFTLSREEYLDERRAGKTRQEIAKEHGINLPGLRYHLRKWDLLDPAIEEAEMDKSSDAAIFVGAETKEPEPIDVEMHYEQTNATSAYDVAFQDALKETAAAMHLPDAAVSHVVETDEHGHFVNIRIPVDFNGWPDSLKSELRTARINRDETILNGAQLLQNAIAWAWVELSDILGPGDYTGQVEQYIERKLVALAE